MALMLDGEKGRPFAFTNPRLDSAAEMSRSDRRRLVSSTITVLTPFVSMVVLSAGEAAHAEIRP
jgi:hypothetical protein